MDTPRTGVTPKSTPSSRSYPEVWRTIRPWAYLLNTNMPKNVAEVDCHFDKALGFLLKYQNMAIPNDDKASEGDKRGKGSASHDNSTINL